MKSEQIFNELRKELSSAGVTNVTGFTSGLTFDRGSDKVIVYANERGNLHVLTGHIDNKKFVKESEVKAASISTLLSILTK